MAFRLYIVPAIGTGSSSQDARRPKYFDGVTKASMDYGFNPLFLVAADLPAPQDASIVANADVFAFPFNLATTVGGGGVNAAQTALETALIPAQWVTGAMTWQAVARAVAGKFQFMQRLNAVLGNEILIDNTTKLNIQFGSIPANIQTAVVQAAQSLGYDTTFITSTTQLRVVLKTLADAWGNKQFQLNQFVF